MTKHNKCTCIYLAENTFITNLSICLKQVLIMLSEMLFFLHHLFLGLPESETFVKNVIFSNNVDQRCNSSAIFLFHDFLCLCDFSFNQYFKHVMRIS